MSEVTSFTRMPSAKVISRSPEFVPLKGTYAFYTGTEWEYYRISLDKDPNGNFLNICSLPSAIATTGKITFTLPKIRDNFVVSITDKQLLRRKFDVRNATRVGNTSPVNSPECTSIPVQHSSTSDEDWIQDSESADVLWEDQERKLQDLADSKEEW